MTPARLPHSDIHGSTPARGSPWLFAACHVLHRLLVPRHPPNALLLLFLQGRTHPFRHAPDPSHHATAPRRGFPPQPGRHIGRPLRDPNPPTRARAPFHAPESRSARQGIPSCRSDLAPRASRRRNQTHIHPDKEPIPPTHSRTPAKPSAPPRPNPKAPRPSGPSPCSPSPARLKTLQAPRPLQAPKTLQANKPLGPNRSRPKPLGSTPSRPDL